MYYLKKMGGEDCDVLLFLSGSLHELFGNLFNHMEYSGVRVCAHTFAAKDGGTRISRIARIYLGHPQGLVAINQGDGSD